MIKEILGTVAGVMFVIIIVAFCVFKIVETRKKGELCDCIGDCEKCKIQCRNNPLYYGNARPKGEMKYEPIKEEYKKRLVYKLGMAGIYLSFVMVIIGTLGSMFRFDDARMLIFVGAYLGLCSYWLTAVAEKFEARKNRKKDKTTKAINETKEKSNG